MEKVLRLYKYIDGINDIAFPNEKEQAIITSFRYDAKRMGAAPTINFSLMHSLCLDSLWDNKVYALFNGERFYVKQTPTSSYSSSDTRYKHEVELVSERFILDNIYFYDVVSSSSQDKPVSNSSKFSFFGNIKEYVSRLNNSLNKSNVGYSIVIDDDILSDEALMSIESQVTFEDQVITNALQEIYNVYKIPYYFVGKNIHVGYYQDNIDTVFKYGCKNSLISISKTNANSKIINKITGVGSSDNIPYYYPNVDEKGITQVLCNGREGIAEITDLAKYRKVKLADKFVFHETIQSLVPLIDEDDYSFGDFRDEGIDGDGKQRVSIDFYYSFTLQQYESVDFSVTTTYEDSLDLRYEIFNPSGQYVAYYKEDKRLNLTGGNYQFVIRWSFLSKEPMIGSDDVIKNFVSQYLKVKANIVVDSSNAWTKNNIPVTLSDYGISVNSPSNGDVLTIERLAYIQPQPNLVPPIYRDTEGDERFYEAINGKYKNEQGGYYQFDNEYTPTNPREHIENFDDIKPTIKNIINGSGYYIDEFIDFAYDLDDNDETDESGKFIHPYFFGKLRRFDGEFGFNLFDHAIDEGEMVVSMTSGTCGSCEFVIGVDEQSQKNIVQVDSDGNLVRDNNGNVRRTGTPQDRQNDTKNNEVWIALKKDIQTFGVVMPNVGNNYRPKAGDKFVLLHIDLPQQYVEAAENALKDKLIKYMHENNFEKFNFSIAFSRIYFAENQTILAKLSENSKIQVEYNKNIYDLYISSLSYSIANDSALPEVKVELEDALSISQNQITQVVESTKREIISSIDKNVFWGDIKGVPTWITSDKPRYSYSELSGRGTSDNSNDVWVVKKDAQGNSYVYTKLDVIVERGVTMYGTDESVDVPSIFEGIPFDNKTIWLNPETKLVEVIGSTEEDEGSADFSNVKTSGEGNAFTSFVLSEDGKELTFVKGETFAKQSDFAALNIKVTDFLEGSDTDDIINKWKELEAFLSGMKESDDLATILATKWTKDDAKIANWDAAFGWGDHSKVGYAKATDVAEELKKYVTLSGTQTITGEKDFTGGLKVNGQPIVYDARGFWKLDGDLIVTGGITMYANEGQYTSSTITDAVNIDNDTLIRVNGVIMLNPDIEIGGGSDIDLSEYAKKATTLSGYGITDAYTKNAVDGLLEDKADTATTLAGYGITNAYTKTQVDNLLGDFVTSDDVETLLEDYLPLTGGTITGDLRLRKGSEYTSPYLYFGDSDEVWLKESNDTHLTIHADGSVKIDSPKTVIDGIEIKKSASGVLFIDANLVVSGGITMYGTDGTTANTIWDDAPIASTSVKGIASFDSEFFAVNNGKVTFIGSTGGGGIDSITKQMVIDALGYTPYDEDNPDGFITSSGTANKANSLTTARTISLTGQATGSTTFNGSADKSIAVTIPTRSVRFNGTKYTVLTNSDTTSDMPNIYAADYAGTANQVLVSGGSGNAPSWVNQSSITSGACSGNAATATTLKTSRTIWGQSFNGSGNVSGNLKLGSSNLLMESDNSYGDSLWAIFAYGPTLQFKHGSAGGSASNMGLQISSTNNQVTTYGSILPSTNLSYNLGSASAKWYNICGAYVYGYNALYVGSSDYFLTTFTNGIQIGTYSLFRINQDGTTRLHMNASGNFGIGTTSPQSKLHVVGTVQADTAFQLPTVDNAFTGGNLLWKLSSTTYGRLGTNTSGDMGIYARSSVVIRGGATGSNAPTTGATIDASGNLLVTGGITMYSDLRKKTILNNVELSLKEVADAPLIEHYYNSDESKRTHVGSVAQYWAELNDWFCKEDDEGFLTMEIQNAALASAISVARELTRYESKTDKKIKKLKKRIGELEEEIENLKKM